MELSYLDLSRAGKGRHIDALYLCTGEILAQNSSSGNMMKLATDIDGDDGHKDDSVELAREIVAANVRNWQTMRGHQTQLKQARLVMLVA